MCAASRVPENVSRTSVVFGVVSLAILLTGFVTGSWVTTREPYRVPGTDAYTAAAFRIGLWKICPTLRRINSTLNFRSLSCKSIRYTSDWDLDLAKEDIGVDSDVYFTQSFVAKMRWCTPLVSISLCLMLAGCVFSFSGHLYKDQKTLIASSLHTLAGLVLAAGLFVFASVLNDSFSPVVYQSVVDDVDAAVAAATVDEDGGGGGGAGNSVEQPAAEYDYRYGWSFVACSLAFLSSEASAVFTITAYFRRLEDRMRYTAVDRKPPPDSPPMQVSCAPTGDRSPSSADTCADAVTVDEHQPRAEQPAAVVSAGAPSTVSVTAGNGNDANGKTPPDICPPKAGDVAAAVKPAATYCSATLNPTHYRQTLAVLCTDGAAGNGYEVDTTKPCTCATSTTTKRYATIAGVVRHNGGKQYCTTTASAATLAKRSSRAGTLTAIKETVVADDGYHGHHQLQSRQNHHHHHQQQQQQQHSHHHLHHQRKPEPPTRRLKTSGYVIPQTPIAALEALDCPPASTLVTPSSV